MRLGLFGFVLCGLFASSLALNLPLGSSTTRNRSRDFQQPGNQETALGSKKSSSSSSSLSSSRVVPKTDPPATAASNCSRVTEHQIQNLNTVLQGALRKISSLDLELELAIDSETLLPLSRSRQSTVNMNNNIRLAVSSQNDPCQRMLLEMKGATEEITKLAELLHEKIQADHPRQHDTAEIRRLKTALETKMRQLNSAAINLEARLNQSRNQGQNRKRRATLIEMSHEVGEVQKLVDVLKSQAEKLELGVQNYQLLITQIREGDLMTALHSWMDLDQYSYGAADSLLKSIVQEAYDGQSIASFRNTLAFSRKLPFLRSQEKAYTTLFEKVKATASETKTGTGHRVDPRVLLPLSSSVLHSIEKYRRLKVSVPAVLTELNKQLDDLILKGILQPWARGIRQGYISPILQFLQRGSEWELDGFSFFLELLIETAYDNSESNFERTLSFVTSLESPRLRVTGLRHLFYLCNHEEDHARRLAFQVKKLESELGRIQGVEERSFVRSEISKLKDALGST